MEKITITRIISIEDQDGKFGPQKKVSFVDSSNRTISGWVPLNQFDPNQWQSGSGIELAITQNGKYTNFKLPSQKTRDKEEIMGALRMIYIKIEAIERALNIKVKLEK